jgi:hypothetical protein
MASIPHKIVPIALALGIAALLSERPQASADEPRTVELKAPLLICRELAGGVRPPAKDGAPVEHDLVFFVLAGRSADGSKICQVAPNDGRHLKISNDRKSMVVKDVALWKGSLKENETVTLLLSVREQDGHDSADSDLEEAREIAPKVDNQKALRELARLPVPEILQGSRGENDHIGTIVVRITNAKGRVTLDTENASHVAYLKGHASNHPLRRAFKLNGDHSDYELHLSLED